MIRACAGASCRRTTTHVDHAPATPCFCVKCWCRHIATPCTRQRAVTLEQKKSRRKTERFKRRPLGRRGGGDVEINQVGAAGNMVRLNGVIVAGEPKGARRVSYWMPERSPPSQEPRASRLPMPQE